MRARRGIEQGEMVFADTPHESPGNIVTEKDASRAGVYGFALLMFAMGFGWCLPSRFRC